MRVKWLPALFLGSLLGITPGCRLGKPDDAAITTDIKAKMYSDPNLKSATVDVSSKDGIVTLSGQVPDDSARLAAYKIATESKGVTKVNDQMTVQAAASNPVAAEPEPAPAPEPKPVRSTSKPKPKPAPRAASSAPPADSMPAPAPSNPDAAASSAANAPPATPQPPQPRTVTVPANTIVSVRTIDSIDSSVNKAGQVFKVSLDAPIVVDDRVIIPTGADAYLKLVNASSAGRIAGRSELTLELNSVVFQGKTYSVETSDVKQSGASRGKRSAATIGGGAVLGALIGGLAGGGKGAAIGAGVGAGAGTGVQVLTKGQQVKIPSETRLDFTLQQPFDVTYIPARRSRSSSSDRPPSADQPNN
jgi:hypothetical protein